MLDDPFPRLLAEATARRGEPGGRTISLGALIRWRRDYEAAGAGKQADGGDWPPVFPKRWKIPSKPSISAIYEALKAKGVAPPSPSPSSRLRGGRSPAWAPSRATGGGWGRAR